MFLDILKSKLPELKIKNKAVIALGCSFVHGQSAFDLDFWDRYEHLSFDLQHSVCFRSRPDKIEFYKNEMLSEYKNLKELPAVHVHTPNRIPINTFFMENDNSFVEVLCREYLTDYVALNFGMRGNGNRATVMQLFRFPEIDFSNMEDIIVLFFPTGLERFDFTAKTPMDHFTHQTLWPHWENNNLSGTKKDLWKGYAFECFSDYHNVFEYLDITSILQMWCKQHNASLYICPAFHDDINEKHFLEVMNSFFPINPFLKDRNIEKINKYPWEKHILLDGCRTMAEYTNKLETGKSGVMLYHQWNYTGSPNKFWSKDAHPNAQAHKNIAHLLSDIVR